MNAKIRIRISKMLGPFFFPKIGFILKKIKLQDGVPVVLKLVFLITSNFENLYRHIIQNVQWSDLVSLFNITFSNL